MTKDEFKEALMSKGWYVFPDMDSSKLTKRQWEIVLSVIRTGESEFVCLAIDEHVFVESTQFIRDALSPESVVTNWHYEEVQGWADSLTGDYSLACKWYRELWIEYILENYKEDI